MLGRQEEGPFEDKDIKEAILSSPLWPIMIVLIIAYEIDRKVIPKITLKINKVISKITEK
jgi:hypothetical protein